MWKAETCASWPGDTCSAGVSTSVKPASKKWRRTVSLMRARARNIGARAAKTSGFHQGSGVGAAKSADDSGEGACIVISLDPRRVQRVARAHARPRVRFGRITHYAPLRYYKDVP